MKTSSRIRTLIKNRLLSHCLSAAVLLGINTNAKAQTATWSGATDSLWSTAANWMDVQPAGNNVVFGNTGKTASNVVGSRVDLSAADENGVLTIRSLAFQNTGAPTGANYQVIEIVEDVTLKISGGSGNILSLGTADLAPTFAVIQGAGTLSIDQSDGNIWIGARQDGASLDLRGLSAFDANVENIYVGIQNAQQVRTGILRLANENTLKAGTLKVGSRAVNTTAVTGELYLGTTNTLAIDDIYVGVDSFVTGTLQFETGLTDAVVTITGRNSTEELPTRANLTIGFSDGSQGNAGTRLLSVAGTADLTGGRVEASLQNLTIGKRTYTGEATGLLKINDGSIDAINTTIGESTAGSATGSFEISGGELTTRTLVLAKGNSTATGTLNISGTAAVTVVHDDDIAGSGGIVLGQGTGTESSSATVNLTGGSLTVHGDIAGETGTLTESTLLLQGGDLNMQGHSIKVDTFALRSGVLRNLGEFNNGADVVKTTADTLLIEGVNTWAGTTVVEAGTVQLGGELSQGNVRVEDGASFSLLNTGTLQFNITGIALSDEFILSMGASAAFAGTLNLNLSADFGDGAWQLFDGTSTGDFASLLGISMDGAFGGALSPINSNLWGMTVGDRNFSFDTVSGVFAISTIPEPGSLILLIGGMIWMFTRRRRA